MKTLAKFIWTDELKYIPLLWKPLAFIFVSYFIIGFFIADRIEKLFIKGKR